MLKKIFIIVAALSISLFSWYEVGSAADDTLIAAALVQGNPTLQGAPGFDYLKSRYRRRRPITLTGRNILIRAILYRGDRTIRRAVSPVSPVVTLPRALPKTGGGGGATRAHFEVF